MVQTGRTLFCKCKTGRIFFCEESHHSCTKAASKRPTVASTCVIHNNNNQEGGGGGKRQQSHHSRVVYMAFFFIRGSSLGLLSCGCVNRIRKAETEIGVSADHLSRKLSREHGFDAYMVGEGFRPILVCKPSFDGQGSECQVERLSEAVRFLMRGHWRNQPAGPPANRASFDLDQALLQEP